MAQHFTTDGFEKEVLEASKDKPVLVDFFAEWCGPCQAQAPIVEELAEEIGDKAVLGKLNTEESPEIASKYGVMSIPTLKIFKDGNIVEDFVGLQSKEDLKAALEKHM